MASKLIIGLGNPGPKYKSTRHNLGFRVLDALCEGHKASWRQSAAVQGALAKVEMGSIECSLLLPMTFMNNSGLSVKSFLHRKPTALEDILVVCDDVSLPFGKMRLRPGGSAGGHNGLKSIMEHVQAKEFARLRMGIGTQGGEIVDHVLSSFTPAEKKALPDFINNALDCITCWVMEGAAGAMNKFNRRENDEHV